MAKRYRIMICDDSERERHRFYARQFDNFHIPHVERKGDRFIDIDPLDSVDKLHKRVLTLREEGNLPDLILLDLFYRKPLSDIDSIEQAFVEELLHFKEDFLRLKRKVLEHLDATGNRCPETDS